ncbi:MAG: (2Fe-2S)-binding protein [Anderseniella sp.]|jgi:predicted molibdopterin-dependent oxidoreductase YjgC|nr:(2Fe-2S)-binding protein [Anderseniella sp.]
MFRRVEQGGPDTCEVVFNGRKLALPRHTNLAASLLAAGIMSFRKTQVSGSPRGPYCMMGACFDCLVKIDGETRQACMETVRDGLMIEQVHGEAGFDE